MPRATAHLYDERFVGYGKDRVSWNYELAAKGAAFLVLPDVFLIHFNTYDEPKKKSKCAPSHPPRARARRPGLGFDYAGHAAYALVFPMRPCPPSCPTYLVRRLEATTLKLLSWQPQALWPRPCSIGAAQLRR